MVKTKISKLYNFNLFYIFNFILTFRIYFLGKIIWKSNVSITFLCIQKCFNFIIFNNFYLYKSKKITPEINKDYKKVKLEITQVNKKKDHLKSIKEKGELKTEYQRILEGTDEKD